MGRTFWLMVDFRTCKYFIVFATQNKHIHTQIYIMHIIYVVTERLALCYWNHFPVKMCACSHKVYTRPFSLKKKDYLVMCYASYSSASYNVSRKYVKVYKIATVTFFYRKFFDLRSLNLTYKFQIYAWNMRCFQQGV